MPDRSENESERFGTESERRPVERFLSEVALRVAAQDWLMLVYLVVLMVRVLLGDGPRRSKAIVGLGAVLAAYVAILWRVRTAKPKTTVLDALLYRLGIILAILGSFLELHWILPTASGRPLDDALHAFDLRVFGVEPSVAWDQFVRPETTEWFSFFYYGYFGIVAAHVVPVFFLARSPRFLVTFGFGFAWIYCIGHVLYTFVPAYGPYAHLTFEHPLEGPLWWQLVQHAAASVDESARTDVFPSIHTAGPVFLTLYAFRHRQDKPFKYIWLPLGFCATQIIIATMFLRWHYLIDIFAGIALAVSGAIVSRYALGWDEARTKAGGPPAWPSLARGAP